MEAREDIKGGCKKEEGRERERLMLPSLEGLGAYEVARTEGETCE